VGRRCERLRARCDEAQEETRHRHSPIRVCDHVQLARLESMAINALSHYLKQVIHAV